MPYRYKPRMGGDSGALKQPTATLNYGNVSWCQCPVPRRVVLAVLGHLMWAICYADRTNISLAIVPMAKEKGWSSDLQGRVLSSFFFGYVTTQLLGGYLSLRYGGKPVLATAVALWSTSTLLTPLAADASFGVLLFCRVTMGIGEGMALPCLHHLTARWIPLTERSTFLATTAVGKFVGTGSAMAAAPLVAAWWPSIFYLFGVVGIVWVIGWQLMASSEPRSCKHIGVAERAYLLAVIEDNEAASVAAAAADSSASGGTETVSLLHQRRPEGAELSRESVDELSSSNTSTSPRVGPDAGPAKQAVANADHPVATVTANRIPAMEEVNLNGLDGTTVADESSSVRNVSYTPPPWREIFACRPLWSVALCHFCVLWAQYLLISWLPTYFTQQVGLELDDSGFALLLPYLSPLVLTPAGGLMADTLVRRGVRVGVVRKAMVTLTLLGPAAAFGFLVANPRPSPAAATIVSTIAVGMLGFGDSGYWAAYVDLSPPYAGLLLGVGNTLGNFAGILVNLSTGFTLEACKCMCYQPWFLYVTQRGRTAPCLLQMKMIQVQGGQ